MSRTSKAARLSLRLPINLKELIEDAAAVMGQSVSDYAVATLVKASEAVLEQSQTTVLSNQQRRTFMTLLDDADAKPNKALADASNRYKNQIR
jgi:uncharacterized protein (DUF1778 family)